MLDGFVIGILWWRRYWLWGFVRLCKSRRYYEADFDGRKYRRIGHEGVSFGSHHLNGLER